MGENVFRGGFRVGTTSSYSLPTTKGASGTSLISDSNGDLYWGTFGLGSIGGSGTSYYVPKWTGASGATGQIALSNSRFYDDGVLGGFNIQNPGNFPGSDFAIESTDINTYLPLQVQRLVSATGTIMQLNNADFFTFISGTAPADSISIGIRSFAGGAKKYNVGLIGSVIGSSEYPMTSNVPENSNIGIFATIQSSSPYQTNPYYYGLVSEISGPSTSNSVIGILSSVSNGGTGSKYAIQLKDGTQGVDKFLKSVTSDGKASWSTLPIATGTSAGTIKVGSGLSIDGSGILSVSGGGGTSTSSGVTGSATSGQLTFWNGTTSIAGDSNLTYDSTNNVLKIEGTGGGLFVDISGDPSPATFPSNPFTALCLISEGKTGTYLPNRMVGSAEGPVQDAPNVIIQSSNPSFPHDGVMGPNIIFAYADDANNGSASGIIGIVAAEGTDFDSEDGTLMVFGTRPHTGLYDPTNGFFGGPYDPKEAIRIGRNQFVGVYYKPGPTQSPPAMLTVGTNLVDSNNIALRETNASQSAITDYGQFYINSTNKKPYFLSSGGTAYDLTTESLGAVMTIGSTASTDLNMANYNINGVTTIKSANNTAEIQTINMINASLLNLMYNT